MRQSGNWRVSKLLKPGNLQKGSRSRYNFRYSDRKPMKRDIHKLLKRMVGARGFEPRASCSRSRRATRLRYAPNLRPGGKTRIIYLIIRAKGMSKFLPIHALQPEDRQVPSPWGALAAPRRKAFEIRRKASSSPPQW